MIIQRRTIAHYTACISKLQHNKLQTVDTIILRS